MLFDECDKTIKDVDYRADIILPMDDFFKFREKAFVSATPILPSDPRFESQGFKIVDIRPTFKYKRPISIVQTNNALEALKEILPQIKAQQKQPRSICFFANSIDMIHQLMSKLGVENESAVFCAEKSVEKLKKKGFKRAYEYWNIKHKMPYMWFTSRNYTAVDIELDEQPDIVFVTEPYFAEYTIIDPCTDAVQAIGRFRNGTSLAIHVVNTNENYPIRTQAGIKEYLKGCRDAYKTIKNLYECATSSESRNAYKAALDILPYNRMLKDGKTNYFAIDNFVDEALVKSAYNNIDSVVNRYKKSSLFLPKLTQPLFYKLGDKERLSLMDKSCSIKESRKRIVELLESLKDDRDSPLAQSFISDIRQVDAFIIDAYDTVGKEVIEVNNYSFKKIKEAMIMKNYREKTSGVEFVQLLKNSFKIGEKYTREYIKKELKRLYALVKTAPKNAITAMTIKDFFKIQECKIGNQKAIRILEPLI